MYVDLSPKWIQILGFIMVLCCSGSINGLLIKVGYLNSNDQVSSLYQGDVTLPICSFFLGMGFAMYLVPRLIYYRNRQSR